MIIRDDGTKISRTQLRRALSRYVNGRASLEALEADFGIAGHKGKFMRRAFASELGAVDVRPKVKVDA